MRTWISRRLRPLLAVSAVVGLAWAGWSPARGDRVVRLVDRPRAARARRRALRRRPAAAGADLRARAAAHRRGRVGRRAGAHVGALVPAALRAQRRRRLRLPRHARASASARRRRRSLTVTGYEQLAVVVAGAAAAMAGFLGAGVHPPVLAIVLFAGRARRPPSPRARPSSAAGSHDRLQARGIETAGPLRGRTLALMVALDAAGWVATGLGAWALARALGATAGLDAFLLLGAFALSWLLGVLVPLAPGGLGLREGSLILALGAGDRRRPGHRAGARAAPGLLRRRAASRSPSPSWRRSAARAARDRRAAAAPAPQPGRSARRGPQRHDRRRPDLLRGRRPARASSSASPRPASSCSWSTTPRPTAPASWPTRSPPSARGCTSFTAPGKDGLGMAYRAGFAWCLERGYRVIGQMDSTSPTRPRSSPRCSRCSTPARPTSCSATATCPAAGRPAGRRPAACSAAWAARGSKLVARPALRRPQRRLQAVAREHAGRARLRLDALHRLRLPGRDDPARLPDGQAHRGGPLRLQRADRGRVEDDARASRWRASA